MNKIIITPLGTISPYLKGNMNCPGFLIEYNNHRILLDCGNGITRLLNFPAYLNNLNVIITHYHKDHIGDIGLIQYASFVYKNLNEIKEKIKIFLPKNDFNFNKEAIISNEESYSEYIDIPDQVELNIGGLRVTFEDNRSHTIESFMVKLESEYFKVVYTSDLGNENLEKVAKFCKNADILICESSLLLEHNLNSKVHLTASDAGKIAKLAQVKELLLTHFWPEEDKKHYLMEAKKEFSNVKVAEEGKKIVLERK